MNNPLIQILNKSLWLNVAHVSWSHVNEDFFLIISIQVVPDSYISKAPHFGCYAPLNYIIWDFLRTELECESLTALTRSYGKSRIKRLAHCSTYKFDFLKGKKN